MSGQKRTLTAQRTLKRQRVSKSGAAQQALQMTDAARTATYVVVARNERGENVETAIAGEHPLTIYLDKREIGITSGISAFAFRARAPPGGRQTDDQIRPEFDAETRSEDCVASACRRADDAPVIVRSRRPGGLWENLGAFLIGLLPHTPLIPAGYAD